MHTVNQCFTDNLFMKNHIITSYVNQFKNLYNNENWIDECYLKKINLISERQAFAKPFPCLHSIAEVLAHVIAWRIELAERFTTGRDPILQSSSPENWQKNAVLEISGWSQLCRELEESQHQLLSILDQRDDEYLRSIWREGQTYEFLVEGLVHHDAYHLGQIGLIHKIISQIVS